MFSSHTGTRKSQRAHSNLVPQSSPGNSLASCDTRTQNQSDGRSGGIQGAVYITRK